MAHIHQKGTTGDSYTYIWAQAPDLQNHPAIINYPDLFEIVNDDPPSNAQILNFSMTEASDE